MTKFFGVALAGLTALGLSLGAMAAEPTSHVRGTIESVKGNTVGIKSYDGNTSDLMLQSSTKYAWVVPSSLSQIKDGEFIGTAATGPDSSMTAQEVVIFPKSMRGMGEGHYPWSMPGAVAQADTGGKAQPASAGAPNVQGTMTNGTVSNGAAATAGSATQGAPPVQGTMTNGTIAANTGKSGGKEITVSYSNGQKVQIFVPANAPVVRFVPAGKSILKAGEKAFVVAGNPSGGNQMAAEFVAVGRNGLMPPM